MKLSMDEQENLLAMFMSSGWDSFYKVMLEAMKKQEYRVLTYNLEDGPEKLVQEKARAEGAKRFMDAITRYRDTVVRGREE